MVSPYSIWSKYTAFLFLHLYVEYPCKILKVDQLLDASVYDTLKDLS